MKGRLGYLGALTMVCGCATSRPFTSQAIQLNSHEFRRAFSRRIYIGPCAEATFRPSFPPCATRCDLGDSRALSCASGRLCFVNDGSGADSMVHAPSPLLSGLSDCPLFIGTHTAPLPSRLGHLCDFVRLSISIQRSTPIDPQTRPRLNGTKLPQPKVGLVTSKNALRVSIDASTPRLLALTGVAATRL
jgi:hypothetical protein